MKKLVSLIVCMLLFYEGMTQVLSFTKVEVQADGSVQLDWNPSGLNGTIQSIELFSKKSTDLSFNLINLNPTNPFQDLSVNAGEESITYAITITTSTTVYSDTVSTIWLQMENIDNKQCKLNWNLPKPSFSEKAQIYRKLPLGSWMWIGSTSLTEYVDVVPTICEDYIGYYIEYTTSGGDLFQSNVPQLLFRDIESPKTPVFQGVSVHGTSQLISLSWAMSPEPDVAGYYICRIYENEQNCIEPDTIWSRSQTSFTCQNCNPESIYQFRIYAFDLCNNTSILTERQHNMVLKAVHPSCTQKVSLSWNPYQNMEGGLAGYRVLAELDHNSPVLLATLDAGTTTYYYEAPSSAGIAVIYVEAFNQSNTLKVNSSSVTLSFVKPQMEIVSASVKENNEIIELQIELDPSLIQQKLELYRGSGIREPKVYKRLSPLGNTLTFFKDEQVEPQNFLYTYFLQTVEGCTSNVTTAIRLQLDQLNSSSVRLDWNSYIGWDAVLYYEIEIRTSSSDWGLAGRVTGADTSFVHMVDAHNPERIFYRVIAYGTGRISISSEVELIREGYISVPTAFSPKSVHNSINSVFKPECHYGIREGYSLSVFSRTGELIFHTTNPDVGWDGKYKGNYCSRGSYVYMIRCIYSSGKSENKTGTVVLFE